MSQPFDRNCHVPSPRNLNKEEGEFWVSNPFEFPSSGENLSGYERNGFFLNAKGGAFHDCSFLSGADSNGDGRSAAAYDLTGDGMPELFVRQAGGGPLLILRNNFPKANWLKVSLRGTKSNRFGIGAKLICQAGDLTIRRELNPIINFLAQEPSMVHFGIGDAKAVDRLEIVWPSGERQQLQDLPANRHLLIREGADPTPVVPGESLATR